MAALALSRCCLQAVHFLHYVMQALAAALEATHSMRVCLALCFAMLAHFGAAEPLQDHKLVSLVRASFSRLPPLPGLVVAQLLLLISFVVLSASHPDVIGTVRLAFFCCLLGGCAAFALLGAEDTHTLATWAHGPEAANELQLPLTCLA